MGWDGMGWDHLRPPRLEEDAEPPPLGARPVILGARRPLRPLEPAELRAWGARSGRVGGCRPRGRSPELQAEGGAGDKEGGKGVCGGGGGGGGGGGDGVGRGNAGQSICAARARRGVRGAHQLCVLNKTVPVDVKRLEDGVNVRP